MHASSLRARFLVALGLASPVVLACEPPLEPHNPPPTGNGPVPSVETIAPPGGTGGQVLPLPAELICSPPGPPPYPGPYCRVHSSCAPPLAEPPPQHYPAPYERCAPSGPGYFARQLSPVDTDAARNAGQAGVCCYRGQEVHPMGRPLRVDGRVELAPLSVGEGWVEGPVEMLDHARRVAIARHYRAVAAVEHASIASFARTSLQLLALGAPASLLHAVHQAARDEIAHAEGALLLASVDGTLRPGPYPAAVAPITATFAALVTDTVVDGCLGETIGALEATAAAERSVDPSIAVFLTRVAEDEADHAELAYRILAWALEQGGAEARLALRAARDRLDEAVDARADDPALDGYGGLRASDRAAIWRAVRASIARPCLDALLDRAA